MYLLLKATNTIPTRVARSAAGLLWVLLISLVCSTSLAAQDKPVDRRLRDTIYRTDGKVYLGRIIHHQPGKETRIASAGGGQFTFRAEHIDQIGWSQRSYSRFMLGISTASSGLATIDIVHLKDGSILRGQLLEYQPGGRLRLKLSTTEVTLDDSEVLKIVQEPVSRQQLRYLRRQYNQVYRFPEKGIYIHTGFGYLPEAGENNAETGLNFQAAVGYQIQRWLGLGVGVGIDDYNVYEFGGSFVPLFVEARGYFTSTLRSPYWILAVGHGIALGSNDDDIWGWEQSREGGRMIYPAIGCRFSGKKSGNLMIDIGYKFQRARYEQMSTFSNEVITQSLIYRRFTLRIGMIF